MDCAYPGTVDAHYTQMLGGHQKGRLYQIVASIEGCDTNKFTGLGYFACKARSLVPKSLMSQAYCV